MSEQVRGALSEGLGPEGEALACVIAYERGDWVEAQEHGGGLSAERLSELYREAAIWADAVAAETR